jgi:hypothetical protein
MDGEKQQGELGEGGMSRTGNQYGGQWKGVWRRFIKRGRVGRRARQKITRVGLAVVMAPACSMCNVLMCSSPVGVLA